MLSVALVWMPCSHLHAVIPTQVKYFVVEEAKYFGLQSLKYRWYIAAKDFFGIFYETDFICLGSFQ